MKRQKADRCARCGAPTETDEQRWWFYDEPLCKECFHNIDEVQACIANINKIHRKALEIARDWQRVVDRKQGRFMPEV